MIVRKGEVGKLLYVGTNYNMSGNSNLSLLFTSPCKETQFTRSAPDVTAPNIPSPDIFEVGILPANQYLVYALQEGDVSEAGEWTVEAVYEDETPKRFIGSPALLIVNDSNL